MAIANQQRVGEALELLREGLADFIQREFQSKYKERALAEAQQFLATGQLNVSAFYVARAEPVSRIISMKKMRPITLLSCLAILFCSLAFCPVKAAEPGLLDGMKLEGSLTEDGTEKAPLEETLTFENGEFISMACVRYGFGKAPYKATREGDKIKWSAEVPSSETQGEKTEWSGTVVGGKLTGHMTWMKANSETIDYSVEAEIPE